MSTPDNLEPDHLDRVVDDVARGMTAGVPPASVRAAVRSRINRSAAAGWRFPAWQPALAATALVLAVGVVGWRLSAPSGTTATDQAVRAVTARPAPAPLRAPDPGAVAPASAPGPRRAVAQPVAAVRSRPIVIAPIELTPMAPSAVGTDPLTPPAPVDVQTFVEPPAHVEPLDLPMPMRAERLEIEPLVIE